MRPLGGSTSWEISLILFRKGIEGFKRYQNKESLQMLVEVQKDLVACLYMSEKSDLAYQAL
jgi:hypothetical protein